MKMKKQKAQKCFSLSKNFDLKNKKIVQKQLNLKMK